MISMINSVTNSDDLSCDNARDFIVLNRADCPSDANWIRPNKNFSGDTKILMGQKCCLLLTGFDDSFWNSRYNSPSNSCRKARLRILNFNFFIYAVVNPTYGFLSALINKLFEL